jgi:VWFA-related protein
MKKLVLLFLLIVCALFLPPNAFSQEVKPTATPPVDNNVLKIPTTLIQVDVSVTDNKGKTVNDLKAEDFEIYENGVKQNVTTFSFISNVRIKNETPRETKNKLTVPIPTAQLRPEQVRRTFALVVDDLSLSFESTAHVRQALKKFVDEQIQDGDLVAIIRTGAGIGALQQFTTDRRQLYAAIEKVKWNPSGKGRLSSFNPFEPTMAERALAMGDTTVTEEDLKADKDFKEGFDDFQGSFFATGTLGALKYIVGGMQEIKGKKSVVLFSDGLQIFNKTEGSTQDASRIGEFLKQLVNLANANSVVFYTIDARGLETTNLSVQDNVMNNDPGKLLQALTEKIDERSAELFNTQDGLVYLARGTGGKAFLNQNDINGSIDKILDDQGYYLLGYQPNADTFDENASRFNKLEVKVLRENLNIRYRTGFFGKPDEKTVRPTKLTVAQQLTNALSSPFGLNDISLKFNTVFNNEKKQGSFVRSLLYVNTKDIKFTDEPGGIKKTTFEVLGVSFGDNGVAVDQISNSYTLTVKNENFTKMLNEGFVYYFTFPIKKPGAYQLRVAIRDSVSGKIGSASQFIEIPNLKKNGLTVSSLVLESMSVENWRKILNYSQKFQWNNKAPDMPNLTNRLIDTSLRKFKRNSVLRYGFEVYNAKLDSSNKPHLATQVRLFRDGQLVLDGEQVPLELLEQKDFEITSGIGVVDLGSQTPSGDYILQIVVIDNLAKEKRKIATQFVQFEIIE